MLELEGMEMGLIKGGCCPVKQPCLRCSFLGTGMRVAIWP